MPRRWPVIVAGVVLLAAVLGSVAVARSAASAAGPDYTRDQAANSAAGELAGKLCGDLEKFPQYAGGEVVSSGLEVQVVGRPTPAMRAVVARDAQRFRGSEIPVRFRSVRYSERELQALEDRILADHPWWATQGIDLTMWMIDLDTNTVKIGLEHYSNHGRSMVLARYGDRVTVFRYDCVPMGA